MSHGKTQRALGRLAELYEYGELQAATDPAVFVDRVAGELRLLRVVAEAARVLLAIYQVDAASVAHHSHLRRAVMALDAFDGGKP